MIAKICSHINISMYSRYSASSKTAEKATYPAGLKHGAGLVEGGTPFGATRVGVIANLDTDRNVDVRAFGIGDSSVQVDTSDEGTPHDDPTY